VRVDDFDVSSSAYTLHDAACEDGRSSYTDPETGYHVFTALGLAARGRCCGSGCRHCPYDHEAVPVDARAERIRQPAWLNEGVAPTEPVDVLFWSGGKDSFLTWRALQREAKRPTVLATTFDVARRTIAHQEIRVEQVVRQAKTLGAPLIGIPLAPGLDYVERVTSGVAIVPVIQRFVFGDLHLEHIRRWRIDALGTLAATRGASLHFPLWGVPYGILLTDLEASGVECEVSAVTEDGSGAVSVGDVFDRALIARLPEHMDAFGENGEFHTLAKVWTGTTLKPRSLG